MQSALQPHANTVFHMGGDEVVISCWQSSQTVTDWLSSQPGHEQLTKADFQWAWLYFQAEALKQLDAAYNNTNPSVILWSSGLTEANVIQENLDATRYIIQTWVPENQSLPQDLIDLGYQVIVSNKDAWYLDWGFHGDGRTYSTWKKAYDARVPAAALGGEVCLWTELIDDYTMDSLLWPRTAAAAERLWSDPDRNETSNAAEGRLLNWRRRVITTRGIQAAAITPEWCELAEGECFRPNTRRVNGRKRHIFNEE
jgi:hexosaminidase